jgi:hypothetical protein
MDWYWWLVIALAVVAALGGSFYLGYLMGQKQGAEEYRAALTQHAADKQRRSARVAPKAESNPMLYPPPMVRFQDGTEVTVAQWAKHYHRQINTPGAHDDPEYGIWARIVSDMYTQASQYVGVARHFNFTDMEALQKKFTAMLWMVLDTGVREKTVGRMKQVHAGYDITEEEYDLVANILVGILGEYHVPQNSIDQVIEIATALKPVIAKPRRASA